MIQHAAKAEADQKVCVQTMQTILNSLATINPRLDTNLCHFFDRAHGVACDKTRIDDDAFFCRTHAPRVFGQAVNQPHLPKLTPAPPITATSVAAMASTLNQNQQTGDLSPDALNNKSNNERYQSSGTFSVNSNDLTSLQESEQEICFEDLEEMMLEERKQQQLDEQQSQQQPPAPPRSISSEKDPPSVKQEQLPPRDRQHHPKRQPPNPLMMMEEMNSSMLRYEALQDIEVMRKQQRDRKVSRHSSTNSGRRKLKEDNESVSSKTPQSPKRSSSYSEEMSSLRKGRVESDEKLYDQMNSSFDRFNELQQMEAERIKRKEERLRRKSEKKLHESIKEHLRQKYPPCAGWQRSGTEWRCSGGCHVVNETDEMIVKLKAAAAKEGAE